MNRRWFVIANNSNAKIYSANPNAAQKHLNLVIELEHPEGMQTNRELMSDRPGHYNTSHTARGGLEAPDYKEIGNDDFARKIAEFLDTERNKQHFYALTLVMLPHFHGLLENHLDKHVKVMVDKVIHKNYGDKPIHELEEILLKSILQN